MFGLSSIRLIVDDLRKGQTDSKRRYASATNKRTGVIIGVRVICGHSGRTQLDHASFFNRIEVAYQHAHDLWHATQKMNMKYISEVGLLAGGNKNSRRHAMFYTILDPCQSSSSGSNAVAQSALMPQLRAGTPIVAPYPYKGDIVLRVDVLTCHDVGIKLQQTLSYALLCSENIPVRCLIGCVDIQSKTALWAQSIKDTGFSDPEAEDAIFLQNSMHPVGTPTQAASPKDESTMPKEGTSTAGNIATEALPSLGKDAMAVDVPNHPDVVMRDTPEVTPMGQQEHSTTLEKSMQYVPINPFARDATKVKEEEFEEVVHISSEPIDIPKLYTHINDDTPYQ